MNDLRKAAEMALDVIIELYNDRGEKCEQNKELFVVADKAIAALEAALAQPEQEPAEISKLKAMHEVCIAVSTRNAQTKLEPVDGYTKSQVHGYTAPPKREWVGLTDEEIDYIFGLAYADDMELLRTIEAKLKDKNG